MKKKTRLVILFACVVLFLLVTPYIIAYSLGYRIDFKHFKMTATGGIYVRTFPTADQIIIDKTNFGKPGYFANDVFIPNLLPAEHSVLIKKAGYYDYSKILPVQEKEVTKIENVSLFKKDILFGILANDTTSPFLQKTSTEKFTIKNNNLYLSITPQISDITATATPTTKPTATIPLIKNILTFALYNDNIVWLSTNGTLFESDLTGKNPVRLTTTPLQISKTGTYKIITDGTNIFVNNNGNLLLLNKKTNTLENFYANIKNQTISPDNKNIIFYTTTEIFISPLSDLAHKRYTLFKSQDPINQLLWLNPNYIIFTAQDKIIISEIDPRGNINNIQLPQPLTLIDGKTIQIISPQILFNPQTKKLYIQTGKTTLVSEQLTQ